MGSLKNEVDQLFLAHVESGNIRYNMYPVGAGVAAVSDGAAAAWAWSAYVQIVAAAVIPNPGWLTGVFMHLPVIEAFYGDYAIAIGGAGVEVDLAEVPFGEELFAVVEGQTFFVPLAYPIRIVGTPRVAVRLRKDTAASAAGCTMKIQIASAVGT
jgi:hypothetical protein